MSAVMEAIKEPLVCRVSSETSWQDAFCGLILDARTGTDKFAAVNLEAGVGKSRETEKIIIRHLQQMRGSKSLRFLIVKQFNEDVYECAEMINREFHPFYRPARAVTFKEWALFQTAPRKFIVPNDVIVITHRRYIQLCTDEHQRSIFTENRQVLIIDEKVNFPIYQFNEAAYKEAIKSLETLLIDRFVDMCTPLIAQLKMLEFGCRETYRLEVDMQLLSEVQGVVEQSIRSGKSKPFAGSFLKCIEVLASTDAIYTDWGKSLSGFLPTEQYWGLENNIILDANAALDYSYRVSNRFIIYEFPRLIDHRQTIIRRIDCSSSNSSISQNTKNYFQQMVGLFKERYSPDKKALFVVRLNYEQTLAAYLREAGFSDIGIGNDYKSSKPDKSIVIDHFGNLLGRNRYGGFDQCWILGTFNMPISAYVLNWFRASDNSFEFCNAAVNKSWNNQTQKGESRKFYDPDYEEMRKSHLIGDFYQTAKRIQRTIQPRAEIFIAVKETEIFKGVVDMMQGIQDGGTIEVNIGKADKEPKERLSKSDQLVNFIRYNMEVGKRYSKKEIRTHPHVDIDERNFALYLGDPLIRLWQEQGWILIESRWITKLRDF